MKLFKILIKNILVKMICQNCLIQKIEKRLNLIFLRKTNQNLVHLKIGSYNLKMSITHFFYSIIYGLLFNKLNGKNIKLENTEKFLGIDLFTDLKKIEKKTMLDHSVFGYFDQCQLINEILSEYGFF